MAPARLRQTYAEAPVLVTLMLLVAGLLGVYWGYRLIGPFLLE